MKANFIVFPAPKSSYRADLLNGQLIWIPRLTQKSSQLFLYQTPREKVNLVLEPKPINDLTQYTSISTHYTATQNKNFSPFVLQQPVSTVHTPKSFFSKNNDAPKLDQGIIISNFQTNFQSNEDDIKNQSKDIELDTSISYTNDIDEYENTDGIPEINIASQKIFQVPKNQFRINSSEQTKIDIDCDDLEVGQQRNPYSLYQNNSDNMQIEGDAKKQNKIQIENKNSETAPCSAVSSARLNLTLQIPTNISLDSHRSLNLGEYDCDGHIPGLFLPSITDSPYLIIYFHGNGEDINLCYEFMNHIRNNLQYNILVVQYPGYGIYQDKQSDANQIIEDALKTYEFMTKMIGFQQKNVIIFGRSIGSGPATQVASMAQPGCLVLLSPFTTLRSVVKDFAGTLVSKIIEERFENIKNIKKVKCPTFIVHGIKDKLIPYTHSQELHKNCGAPCELILPQLMTHSQFEFFEDFTQPLMNFLRKNQFELFKFTQSQCPLIPLDLFKDPNSKDKMNIQ